MVNHIMMKEGNFLEKNTMQGTLSGARNKGRPHATWLMIRCGLG